MLPGMPSDESPSLATARSRWPSPWQGSVKTQPPPHLRGQVYTEKNPGLRRRSGLQLQPRTRGVWSCCCRRNHDEAENASPESAAADQRGIKEATLQQESP